MKKIVETNGLRYMTKIYDFDFYRLKKEGHNISVVKKYNRETETNFAEYRLLSNDDNGQIGFI